MTEKTVTQEATDIATLPPADRALIVLDSTKTEEHLNALVVEAAPITEVVNAAGREQAHRVGMKLKNARITIEKTGKAAREDAQAFSKAVIEEEKRLKGIIASEETRVIGLRDGYDAAIEAERAAKAAAEAARVGAIQTKIASIRSLPMMLAGETSGVILGELHALTEFTPEEATFAEFTADCEQARHEVMGALRELGERVKAQEDAFAGAEAERIRLAAERKVLEDERAAMEAERAAWLAEKAAFEARKAPPALPITMEPDEPEAIPPQSDAEIEAVRAVSASDTPDHIDQPVEELPTVSAWRIRRIALATANQFTALADKTMLCGAFAFADQLRAAAYSVREGDFDAALAGVDFEALVTIENSMVDAAVECIEAINSDLAQSA